VRNRIKARNGMPGAPSEKEKQDERRYAHFANYRATGSPRQLPDRALLPIYRSECESMWEVMRYRTCVRLSVKNAATLWKLVKQEKMAATTVVAWCDPRCRSAGGGARPTKAIERI
jgi:hypothetical protein